jgi:hypothetical protein
VFVPAVISSPVLHTVWLFSEFLTCPWRLGKNCAMLNALSGNCSYRDKYKELFTESLVSLPDSFSPLNDDMESDKNW